MRSPSPLRYPGGKVSLSETLRSLLYANGLQGGTYVEPFAGGAGAGIKLLRDGHVDRIIINDRDRAIFCFWNSVMRRPEELTERIRNTPLTIPEWKRQREIYRSPGTRTQIEIGFAAFYLNRCNRSGIITNGGPIGGLEQAGEWKLDARFNRAELAARITELATYGDRIQILREDGIALIKRLKDYADPDTSFVYGDPPYFVKGKGLYLNHFSKADHAALAALMVKQKRLAWVMTYDDVPEVRALYTWAKIQSFKLRYSAHRSSLEGREVLITPNHLSVGVDIASLLAKRARNTVD